MKSGYPSLVVCISNIVDDKRGKPVYRFQTDEIEINKKMKRRNKFTLIGWGVNCNLWIYQVSFSRPIRAKAALKSLTNKSVNFDKNKEIYYSE